MAVYSQGASAISWLGSQTSLVETTVSLVALPLRSPHKKNMLAQAINQDL